MIYELEYQQTTASGNTPYEMLFLKDIKSKDISNDGFASRNLIERFKNQGMEPTHYDSDVDLFFIVSQPKDVKKDAIEEGKFWAAINYYDSKECNFHFTTIGRDFGIEETSKYVTPLYYMEQYYKLKEEVAELKKDMGDFFKPLLEKYDVTVVSNDWQMENYIPGIKSVELTKKKEQK